MTDERAALFDNLRNMKLLLVEDDALLRNSLRLFFENEGCRLDALETGEEGLAAVEEGAYDIVISDFRLPGMDGLHLLRRVHDRWPQTMKVLLTAYLDEEVLSDAFRIGVQEFIEKPFTSADLEEALGRLIEKRTKRPVA